MSPASINGSPFGAQQAEPLFTWVHLSDIHAGHGSAKHRVDQLKTLEKLVEDLGRIPQPFRPVDAVFVTGDIAFSGGALNDKEYDQAYQFLDEVRTALKLDWSRIFTVPGNHDVQREQPNGMSWLLIDRLRSGDSVDTALGDAEKHSHLEARFAGYRQFAKKLGNGCSDLWWTRTITGRRGLRIRLVGLNSALLSLDGKDRGRLQMGLTQLRDLKSDTKSREFVIALMHHPLDWLLQQDDVRSWLRLSAHLQLCGHMHEAQTWRLQSGAGSELVQILAGAAHPEEEFTGENVPPLLQNALPLTGYGYNVGTLMQGEKGQIQIWFRPRTFSFRNKRFQVDADGTPDGSEVGFHDTTFLPTLEPEQPLRLHPREEVPRQGPWVFDTQTVSAVCESLDDTSAARLRHVQEFLDFMARSFENLFQLEHHSLDVHPFFKNVRERLKAMTPGVSLNESDGVLLRANVRHVILRTQTLLELLRKIGAADLEECGQRIGSSAAEDIIRHTLVRGHAIPANPEAFVALWDFWDRTGGWGKLSLDPSAGEGTDEDRTRTWRLRISRNFLTVENDTEESHRLNSFWCGYIHGFLAKALPAIEDEMAKADPATFSQQITFPAYNQVTKVQLLEDNLFEIRFEEHRFSRALAALATSMKRLHAQDYEGAAVSAWGALMAAEKIVGLAAFEEFLAKATEEERETVNVMKKDFMAKPLDVNETIALRWFGIVNRLIRKLAYPEGVGVHDAAAAHSVVH